MVEYTVVSASNRNNAEALNTLIGIVELASNRLSHSASCPWPVGRCNCGIEWFRGAVDIFRVEHPELFKGKEAGDESR